MGNQLIDDIAEENKEGFFQFVKRFHVYLSISLLGKRSRGPCQSQGLGIGKKHVAMLLNCLEETEKLRTES